MAIHLNIGDAHEIDGKKFTVQEWSELKDGDYFYHPFMGFIDKYSTSIDYGGFDPNSLQCWKLVPMP